MTVSEKGLALIRHMEGLRLAAYRDTGGVWTIGYGCTGPSIKQGVVWTQEQADSQLKMRTDAIASILSGCVVPQLSQNQFDALVSFCYNVGQNAFRGSTLLRKLNTRDFQGAADELLRWNHDNGKVDPILTKRREAERALFLQP